MNTYSWRCERSVGRLGGDLLVPISDALVPGRGYDSRSRWGVLGQTPPGVKGAIIVALESLITRGMNLIRVPRDGMTSGLVRHFDTCVHVHTATAMMMVCNIVVRLILIIVDRTRHLFPTVAVWLEHQGYLVVEADTSAQWTVLVSLHPGN